MLSYLLSNMTVRSMAAGALLAIGLCRGVCRANPNSGGPMNPLDIHNLTNGQPLLSTADGLFASLFKDIQAISANPARVAGKKLGELNVQIRQLRRTALDLQLLGETAGADYRLRADVLGAQLEDIAEVFRTTPAGKQYCSQDSQYLSSPKAAQARDATLRNVKQMLAAGKLDEAFKNFNEAFDQLTYLTMVLGRPGRPYEAPFAMLELQVNPGRNTAFRQRAQAALDQAAASLLPKTQELLQSVASTAATLRTAPSATVGDQTLNGPQCLESFGTTWQQLHLSAVRCRAVAWACTTGIPDAGCSQRTGPPRIVDADYRRFYEEMATALASLIEADAQRAAANDVRALYVQYLQVLAPLVANTRDDKLKLAVQPALDKLAAKSTSFAEEVRTYVTATHELLRWRQRLAAAAAASAAATFSPSDQAMLKFFVSDGEYRGLFKPDDRDPSFAILMASCPSVIQPAMQRALEQPVRVRDIVGLSGRKMGVARYGSRHYATVPLPDVSSERVKLQQDLLITAQQPALSLESMMAVDSAQRGNYVAAGGTVNCFHLEGLIPRFAALRPEAQQLVALGPLPAEVLPESIIDHVLVRFDVTPAWVHHTYFFLPVTRAAAATDAK